MSDTTNREGQQGSRIEEHGRIYTQNGNNNQQFNADTINYTEAMPQRNETPPLPLSTVPFTRDPRFIERKEFTQLQQKLTAGRRVAINGLGGVGLGDTSQPAFALILAKSNRKSQLAIEYCHRMREQSPDTWVFWLHASNATRFDQEIVSLAEEIKLQGRRTKDVNIYQLLRNWLIDSGKSKKWLIALDNADYAEFLFEAPQATMNPRRRIDYIPTCAHGSLLVTSRWIKISKHMVDDSDIIVLEPEKQHATELLKSKLMGEHPDGSVEKLAETLEYIALAISQATAYINARNARCTVEDHIKKLDKSERSKIRLLTSGVNDIRRDSRETETSNAILLTWKLSFEHIRSIQQSAADLLSLMSFYDHQSIPEYLLYPVSAHTRTRSNTAGDARSENNAEDDIRSQSSLQDGARSRNSTEDDAEEAVENDLLLLQEFSLISQTLGKSVLQMHRLVQLSTQIWLKEHDQHADMEVRSLQMLDKQFSDAVFERRHRCRSLFPHANRALNSETRDAGGLASLESLLRKAARLAWQHSDYNQAEIMVRRTIDISTSRNGMEHRKTLASMSNLALIYSDRGQWQEAEALQVKVVEILKRVLGEDHVSTVASKTSLAAKYTKQGRLREAEALQIRTLKIQEKVLGEEHLNTLLSMNNLGYMYGRQGRWREAEALQVKVVETLSRVFGEENPYMLASMYNLASTYENDPKRWDEAEALRVKALELSERVLGEDHPSTLTSMSNLALTYTLNQERWREAEPLQVKVLETRWKVLGEEHPSTLTSMHNLACTYHDQGKWQQAQDLMTRCAEARARVLGATHPYTQSSKLWLRDISSACKKISVERAESAA